MSDRADDHPLAIQTKDLCHRYGSRRGIQNVSLTIRAGEIFGFLGPNGAGKSTTIRILMGLLRSQSGASQIFGQDCWSAGPEIRRQVGYVPGDVRLYPWLTTHSALKILSGVHGCDLFPAGLEIAERFRLEPNLSVRRMSRGNRQKVAIVLAMAHQPRLVILDEPTSGLDPLMQETLLQCLREMAAAGRTVMFSSHTLSEVESLCDHIAIVKDGQIVEDSTVTRLKSLAPRQIMVTLRADQNSNQISWPTSLRAVAHQSALQRHDSVTNSRTRSTGSICAFELIGSSAPFLEWAASQRFEDVTIGPPSLEVLFRRYYDISQDTDE